MPLGERAAAASVRSGDVATQRFTWCARDSSYLRTCALGTEPIGALIVLLLELELACSITQHRARAATASWALWV